MVRNEVIVLLCRLAVYVMAVLVVLVLASIVAYTGPERVLGALEKAETLYAIVLSVVVAGVVAAAALATSIPVAYALSRGATRSMAVEAVLLLPFGMPPVAIGASLLLFFAGPGSVVDKLVGVVFTPLGLVVAQYAVVLPMTIRVLRSAFDAVDYRYEAVARTLGYSRLGTLIHVTLPMAKRGLYTALLLAFTRALGEFGASVMLAGAVRFKTETIPIAIYLAMSSGDTGLALALVLVSALVSAASVTGLLLIERRGGPGHS